MKKINKHINNLIFVCICILSLILGYFAGTAINNKHFCVNKYSGLNKAELVDDISSIDYEGKTPDQLSASDAYNIAMYKLDLQENYYRLTIGDLQTSVGIKQTVNSIISKSGDTYRQEFCTYSSMIKRAGKCTFKKNDDIFLYEGKPSGPALEEVKWTDKYQHYSYVDYATLLGREPAFDEHYIISSKTILSANQCVQDGDLYTFKVTLDPTLSTITYVDEVSFISNIDKSTISFSSIECEFTMDKEFRIITQKNCEVYSLKYGGIPVTITAYYDITTTY